MHNRMIKMNLKIFYEKHVPQASFHAAHVFGKTSAAGQILNQAKCAAGQIWNQAKCPAD